MIKNNLKHIIRTRIKPAVVNSTLDPHSQIAFRAGPTAKVHTTRLVASRAIITGRAWARPPTHPPTHKYKSFLHARAQSFILSARRESDDAWPLSNLRRNSRTTRAV